MLSVVVCTSCGSRTPAELAPNEMELANVGMLERRCSRCARATRWGFTRDYRRRDRRQLERRRADRRVAANPNYAGPERRKGPMRLGERRVGDRRARG
jgi:hypothetical protein